MTVTVTVVVIGEGVGVEGTGLGDEDVTELVLETRHGDTDEFAIGVVGDGDGVEGALDLVDGGEVAVGFVVGGGEDGAFVV